MTAVEPAPVALITGAGRGIGRSIATALSADGYRVALTARSADQLAETASGCVGESLVIAGDLAAPGFVDGLFDEVEARLGPVSVLILNAGRGASDPIDRATDEDWDQVLALNLTAPFRCVRRAVPAMRQAGTGRIVAIGSILSRRGDKYLAAYAASKHGLLGLMRSVATELAGTGVTANTVCPAYVDTPMTDATVAGIVAKTGRTEEQARAYLAKVQPIGRLIQPDEVTEAVMLCVRSGAITGQAINVDGGVMQA